MANVTLRLVKGTPLTNQEVDNNFSNLNIFKTEIGGDLGGNVLYPTVIGIQGRSVSSDTPANTQVLVWSDTANAWIPGNAASSYADLTNKPAVNVTFTGDVTGAGNVLLTNGGTNSLSIALTVQANSIALGTDTTGNYTDRVIAGNGIIATGTADEGNVITVGLTNTGVSATTYGNATIVPVITIDDQGRITSASNVTIAGGGAAAVLDAQKNFTVVDANSLTTTGCHNTFIGENAGRCTTSGSYNFFAGQCAGYCNDTGSQNIFLGACTGSLNTVSNNNVYIGNRAGEFATGVGNNYFGASSGAGTCAACPNTGCYNNFLGATAGARSGSGSYNNFFGSLTGTYNTTGSYNNFFGRLSGSGNTTGSHNNFFGKFTAPFNTTGSHNNFIGNYAGKYNCTGSHNNFLGYYAGHCNTEGNNNTFIGRLAGCAIVTGSNNLIIGSIIGTSDLSNTVIIAAGACERIKVDNSGLSINGSPFTGGGASLDAQKNFAVVDACSLTSTGCNNILIGLNAGRCTTFGKYNSFLGNAAGFCNTTGCHNFFAGRCAGRNNSTGNFNFFAGQFAGCCNNANNNIIIGCSAGRNNQSGSNNIFLGANSGGQNTTGSSNNFFGTSAGSRNTSGSNSNFFGASAGFYTTTGSDNAFFGPSSGYYNTTGCNNVFIGRSAGYYSNGAHNLFLGRYAGFCNTTGCYNFFAGCCAGALNQAGCNNLYIGCNSGCAVTSGGNNIILGPVVGTSSLANTIILATGTCVRIRTDGELGNTTITGNVIASAFFGDGSKLTGISAGSQVSYIGNVFIATASQTLFNVSYTVGLVEVFKNGAKLIVNSDFYANTGSNITLSSPAIVDDVIEIVSFQSFTVADTYTKGEADNLFFEAASFTGNAILSQLLGVDGTGSGLDADLLDGENGSYYLNYANTTNPPAANIVLSGDVSGSANAILTANSTVINVTTTIQPNSVELGTDTTGDYVVSVGGYTGNVSNANLLSSILTVDGSNSGLDADTVDGIHIQVVSALPGSPDPNTFYIVTG